MLLSYHAEVERAERLQKLENVLGFTSVVLEVCHSEKRYCLTSSGIIIIKDIAKDYVVTAMMATIDQCYRLYRLAGKSQISPKIYKRVKKNQERHYELLHIDC